MGMAVDWVVTTVDLNIGIVSTQRHIEVEVSVPYDGF